ncbi:hypothetical protein M413DRAFT_447585 [Hebeloma cylindrosporum]|uniref:MYND-type domain-containing protein n=1 Tax=Hebeloma cylindrosporum TaxID=76867 RepID=A0A0C2XMH6_HEBCY|nr:hypothetical protein M413DRAFT_447585 [Hebeloma cylindrosporum h7]
MPSERNCSVCDKAETTENAIQRCSRCQDRFYCGRECQTADWGTHKRSCRSKNNRVTPVWYDRYRKCNDGNLHEGKLELMTWPSEKEELGWGGVCVEESEDHKRKFEEEFGGDEERFYKYWPQGFRWTCCGTDADMKWGCDHHGTGSRPCTCDYMGHIL